MVDSVNLFGLVATEAALTEGEPWRLALLAYLESNRDLLLEAIQAHLPGVQVSRPEATFLAWLDCSGLGLDREPQQFFLEEAKVALSAGSEFGPGQRDRVRLNFGCSRALLAEGIRRMADSLTRRST
jgi:cystathionine beta-lyase